VAQNTKLDNFAECHTDKQTDSRLQVMCSGLEHQPTNTVTSWRRCLLFSDDPKWERIGEAHL